MLGTPFTARLSPSGHEGEPLLPQLLKDLIILSYHSGRLVWSVATPSRNLDDWIGPATDDTITRTGRTAAVSTRQRHGRVSARRRTAPPPPMDAAC